MEKLENLHNDDSHVELKKEKKMDTIVNSNFPYDKIGKDIFLIQAICIL